MTSESYPETLLVGLAIEDYRYYFFRELRELMGSKLSIVSGNEHFARAYAMGSMMAGLPQLSEARNSYVLDRRLVVQRGANRRMLDAEVLVFEFNPRFFNLWPVLLARRALGRPSLGWGHVYSRAGSESRTNTLRQALRSLATGSLLYTDGEQREFRDRYDSHPTWVAPNALYSRADLADLSQPASERSNIVFVSRLVAEKRPALALQTIRQFRDRTGWQGKLLIAGEGPEEAALRKLATELDLDDSIDWLGRVFGVDGLAAAYNTAFAAINPGYVGLSIVQAGSFGVPLVYPDGLVDHAPEIDLASPGVNAFAATDASVDALTTALVAAYDSHRADPGGAYERCRQSILERHSAEGMALGFATAVTEVAKVGAR